MHTESLKRHFFTCIAVALFETAVSVAGAIDTSPYALTHSPIWSNATTVILVGAANPNGTSSTGWFEWGTSTNYENRTAPIDLSDGSRSIWLTKEINASKPLTMYHVRLVVSNSAAVAYGADRVFSAARRLDGGGTRFAYDPNLPDLTNLVSIGAGRGHSLALTSKGEVRAWGDNTYGQTNVPPNLSGISAIAAGAYHDLALTLNGRVTAWGYNEYGQTNVPPGLTSVVAIAAGIFHSIALRADGTVVHWGDNRFGQGNIPAASNDIVAISAGLLHNLALRSDGTVLAWGRNGDGEATVPAGLTEVIAIAAGGYHSLALRRDGTLVAWGRNAEGQTTIPTGLGEVMEVKGGEFYTLALRRIGTIAGWGTVPGVPGGSNVITIAAGQFHDLALVGNGRPTAVSQSVSGLPDSSTTISLSGSDPDQDPITFRITALPTAGKLYQYDNDGVGALITAPGTIVSDAAARVIFAPESGGFGSPHATFGFVTDDQSADSAEASVTLNILGPPLAATQRPTWLNATTMVLNGACRPGATSIAWFDWGTTKEYGHQTLSTNVPASVRLNRVSITLSNLATGQPYYARLVVSNRFGVAYASQQIVAVAPKLLSWSVSSPSTDSHEGLTNIVAIAGGDEHSVAATVGGAVVGWGANWAGQLNVPTDLSNVFGVAAGEVHTLAVTRDGHVTAWGANWDGQTAVPTDLQNVVAVAAGLDHSLALTSDGEVVTWGYAGCGNSSGLRAIPADLHDAVAIAAGDCHSAALRIDGTVVTWGGVDWAQPPVGLSNIVAISASGSHTLALTAQGTVAAWGEDDYGECDIPPGTTNILAIAAGGVHSLALRSDGTIVGWGNDQWGVATPANLSNVVDIAAGYSHSLATVGYPQLPNVTTRPASDVSRTAATLNSLIASPQFPGEAWFQWGRTTNYDSLTPPARFDANTNQHLRTWRLTNLIAGVSYHYRAVASNSVEIVSGADETFIPSPAPAQSVSLTVLDNRRFRLDFVGSSDSDYVVVASSNVAAPLTTWPVLGMATQAGTGTFVFIDAQQTNSQRFYQIRSN